MLTVFVSDAVVTAVILNTTFIRALTSLARANTAVRHTQKVGSMKRENQKINANIKARFLGYCLSDCWIIHVAYNYCER